MEIKPTKGPTALSVDVLQQITIDLGIYYLYDSNFSPAGPTYHAAFRSGAALVEELNKIFRPACVQFKLNTEELLNLHFNVDPPDDIVQGDTMGSGLDQLAPEVARIINPLQWGEYDDPATPLPPRRKMCLVIARQLQLHDPRTLGITPLTTERRVALVGTKAFEKLGDPHGTPEPANSSSYGLMDFYITCAHEIGHLLFLSSRTGSVLTKVEETMTINAGGGHDPGRFPANDYYLDGIPIIPPAIQNKSRLDGGLMKQGDKRWRWMRREDWLRANVIARRFILSSP